ncbi:hypothetical protein Y032_0290g1526 [Ancylostoma ceylanicum]|nr:hypothetical protein Y032_0290g1526 [Ancylostoma ceylanicum]
MKHLLANIFTGFSKVYSQFKCMGLDSVGDHVTPSFYFVLRGSCELYISSEPIPEELYYSTYHRCYLDQYRPIIFSWDSNNLSIITKRGHLLSMLIIPVTDLLEEPMLEKIPLGLLHPLDFILVESIHEDVTTCHRSVPLTNKLLCYAFDGLFNITEYEIIVGPHWGDKIRQTIITLPHSLHYEPYIASYADHKGKNRLWVKNRLNWFFNFNIAKAAARGYERVSPRKYEIKDEHDFKTISSDIIYADAGGIVTKRCYKYLITGCLYRYSITKENPMTSLCLYDEHYKIYPGVVFKSWPTATTPAPALRIVVYAAYSQPYVFQSTPAWSSAVPPSLSSTSTSRFRNTEPG